MKQQAAGYAHLAQAYGQSYVEEYGMKEKWADGDAPSFRALYAVGVIVFFTFLCFHTFLLFFHSGMIYGLTIIIVIFCLHNILWRHKSRKLLHNSTTILVGVFWGAFLGRICYDNYSYYMFMYSNSRTYYDVVPSIPSESVADGGRIVFAKEAHLDKAAAVGFAADDGRTYCVAPIRDLTETSRVEYWAIGTDCCQWNPPSFACGAADDAEARGGAVIFNHIGWFGSEIRLDHFTTATRKAAATYDLELSDRPLYVRWVDDSTLEGLSSSYKSSSWTFILLAFIGFAAIQFFALRLRYRKPAM